MHYHWEPLADGVHRCRLPFLDVTVGVVQGSTGILLIDSGTTLLEASCIAEDVAVITGGAVTHVVLTHHHFDHVLGSAGFPGAVSYGPPAVAAALTTRIGEVRAHALEFGADPEAVDRAIAAIRAPDHEVMTVDLDLGGRTVHVEHPGPGHTDHDLVIVVPGERAVVFCGDLVEESAEPAIDAGSELRAWPQTLDRVLALGGPDGIYVPGHGAVVDAAFVGRQRDWLRNRS
jgi:glyoxylase-like metal-dependent hydrolase (beta-lactamase superfamily II)